MSIPISNPRQADLAAQYRPKDTTAPPRWYEQNYGQPGNNVQNKAAKAVLGTVLNMFDVPVQAIGGMHRDAVAGNLLGGQSPGSRALQNYGQQVGGLWSDVFKPGQGQTPLFLPREFEAAGEAAVDRFGLEGGAALAARGGATALDLLTGLVAGGVGGVGRGTVRAAARAGKEFVTDPTVQARTNALMGRLYHGNRGGAWTTAANRPFNERPGWFNADLFGTSSKDLGQQYARANPNNKFGGASHLMPGTENLTRLRNLPKDLKVLDLMPGGKSVAEQSPELAEALGKLASGFDDVANPARHIPLTELPNDIFKQTLEQFGFNGLRHVSGQGGMFTDGAVSKPVYAFFNPSGITSTPVAPSMSQRVGEKLYQTPSRFLDTIQEVLEKSRGTVAAGQSKLPGAVTQFLRRRGGGIEDEYGEGLGLTRTFTGGDGSMGLPYNPYNLGTLTRSLAQRTKETPGMAPPAFG